MEPARYLFHLRRELDAFGACLHGELLLPVRHCGDWTLYDLADHLGRGNLWAAAAVTERSGNHVADTALRDPAELVTWFQGTSTKLLNALNTDPSTEAWTFSPPHTVGFWQRRRSLETLVHRWDAEHATGVDDRIDPALASDGVAEVIDTFVPRQVKRGRLSSPQHAIHLIATDTGSSWNLGTGAPLATATATAENLLLMLWDRLPASDPAIKWEGDLDAGYSLLDAPLVP
jgi:uncharacterized protein (TIGR03083 family)